jgi:predicted ATPase
LFFSALTAFQLRDRQFVERLASELEALTDEHRLPVYQSNGLMLQGAVLGWQGQPQEGLEKVEQASETKDSVFFPIWLLIRAELLRDLGRAEDALASITEGFTVISESHGHWGDAELHRVCGELYESLSRESEAETAYVTALRIAREQEAKWWELRTSTSLARLWQGQGKTNEARDLLAPVYNWFTEGFDTDDLKEAKALLNELG